MIEADFILRTRTSYDAIAVEYDELARDEMDRKPLDRAMAGAFADLVRGRGPVVDVGCGTGNLTRFLHERGVEVFGVDLSPGMLALAGKTLPDVRFVEGSMLDLPVPDSSVVGVAAWYSTIHIPDELLPQALAEFHRVLAPGGYALLAFQVGEEPLHLTDALGHQIDLLFHRRRAEQMARLLRAAGLPTHARLEREPEDERAPQAFLLARKDVTD
ncbi:class I SAM-dependent methyltransferase [Nonomuraea endophytica]|uniref:Ubiquinone/menaquinone biosynthesis C-methylase UbiE n=1 Tax=Nonomuraea endophytica TaxID=714136 RepID=A0A7W8EJJ3_9ACTN|nr:class I SAM-dependent methyltransferase [Nonomuraea endophytica]MBB5081623.1 ubiquinone/menaquinone biosynthesis C-methylase UbiE [Nonomuraea endophytica]